MMSSPICPSPSEGGQMSAFFCVDIILQFQVVVPDAIRLTLDFSCPCTKRLSLGEPQI